MKYNLKEKIDLVVPTSATHFKVWFLKHWGIHHSISYKPNPTTTNTVTTQIPQVYPDDKYSYKIHIGCTTTTEKEGEEFARYLGSFDVITINAIELDSGRVELEITCFHPLVWEELVLPFLEKLKNTWHIENETKPPVETGDSQVSERDRKIIDMWNEGYSSTEIGPLFKLAPRTIINITNKWRGKLGKEKVRYH